MHHKPDFLTVRQIGVALILIGFFGFIAAGCGPVTSSSAQTLQSDVVSAENTPLPTATATTTTSAALSTVPPATNTPLPTATATATATMTSPPPEDTATPLPVISAAQEPVVAPTLIPVAELLNAIPKPTPPRNTYSETVRVPILMYHYISTPPADADKYRLDLSVTPENFAQQMQYLADNGYTPIDLYDLSFAITRQQPLPEKPIILTFDDGYRDNYENAVPVLQQFGFTGTFFVITSYIDQGLEQYLTWDMVTDMSRAGMRIESHTVTHPQLAGATRDDQYFQIQASQAAIAAHINYTPRYLCYPGGFYDETTMTVAEELGMWGAVTTQSGAWHDYDSRFEWSRLRIRNTTTLGVFAGLLEQY